MEELFYDKDNNGYTVDDITDCLRKIGADECDVLFIHSDIIFGKPGHGFRRKDYLFALYRSIEQLGVKSILVPTFTYSFPNHEDYDVFNSRSLMGSLSEYIRKLDNRYRTLDPLLSFSVPQELKKQFEALGSNSLGEGSGFDVLHSMDGVKFLFFGAEMGECFTYVHYVEKMMDVPYRFDMSFEGNVIDYNGKKTKTIQTIHTQCGGVKLYEKNEAFEQELTDRGILRKQRLGDGFVACISEKDAYREIKEHISKDRFCFVAVPYTDDDLTHEYVYDYHLGKITHC